MTSFILILLYNLVITVIYNKNKNIQWTQWRNVNVKLGSATTHTRKMIEMIGLESMAFALHIVEDMISCNID